MRAAGADPLVCALTGTQEPPLCAFDPEFDAIVVSEETVQGAHTINQARFSPA